MFEAYRNRMSRRHGSYMGETLRKQTNMVLDATWMNSVSTRPVQVKVIDSGLPPTYESVDEFEDVLWAHFEENTKFNITKDEVDRFLVFRPGEIVRHPEIRVGAYVCIPDTDGVLGWWIIVYIDDDNELRKTHVLRADQIFKWVKDGKIYQCLGCNRVANSYNSGSWDGDRFTFVDNIYGAWLPTNNDTVNLTYNQRLIISDERRKIPIVWTVSKIG